MTAPSDFDWKNPDYGPVWNERARRLLRLREPGFDIGALKKFYRDHPAQWISDWCVTVDPRAAEAGRDVSMPFLLFPRQVELVERIYANWRARKDLLIEKTRDFGASYACCAVAVHMLCFYPGTVIGFGSRKVDLVDGDSKALFPKMRDMINNLPIELRPDCDMTFMRIHNNDNGASITGEGGDNIGRGGRTSLYFVDEHAHLERAELAEAALSANTNCRVFLSTPAGPGNLFARKRHSGKIDVVTLRWTDDPRKDAQWLLDMKSKFDPVVVAQEILIDYNASVDNAFIPGEPVRAAMDRDSSLVQPVGPTIMGIDCARYGSDKSVISIRQGRLLYPQMVFAKADTVDAAGRAADLVRRWPEPIDQIAVDTIGIGAGVADTLRRTFGDRVVDVNSALRVDDGENFNLRARMWRDMRDWLKAGACIPNDPELMVDLTGLQYHYKENLLLIENKDAAKRRGVKSPDRADSIALTFAYPPQAKRADPLPAPAAWGVLDDAIAGY